VTVSELFITVIHEVKAWRRGLTRSTLRWTYPLFAAGKEVEQLNLMTLPLQREVLRGLSKMLKAQRGANLPAMGIAHRETANVFVFQTPLVDRLCLKAIFLT